MTGIPTVSSLWQFLQDSETLKGDFTLYAPYGPRNCHTANILDSYTEYLGRFGHKKQYNLRRQIRLLDQFGRGSLLLQRIDSVPTTRLFHDAWVALGPQSKRKNGGEIPLTELVDLAERRLLLSYVLSINGSPCGAVLGTRFRDTLMIHTLRHDEGISRLSPGTVLHTLMMKDLIENRLARRIDYGFGEPKYRLHNDMDERVHAILVRNGGINSSLVAAHGSFAKMIDGVKRFAHRPALAACRT